MKRKVVGLFALVLIVVYSLTLISSAATQESMFGSKTGSAYYDNVAYELGTQFSSSVDGIVTAVKVYTVTGETGNHTVRIWNNSSNTVVGGPYTWSYTGNNTWQTFTLPTPVNITASTVYTVAVSTGADTTKYYTALSGDLTSGGNNSNHLSWSANAGVFSTSAGSRPTSTFGGNNYLRDVVFVASDGNIALSKTVTYSSQEVGNEAANVVDGNTTSNRWSGSTATYPQWVQVDLGAVHNINQTELYPYLSRAYQYTIETSTDGINYSTVIDQSTNTTGASVLTDSFSATNARYVKLTVTGASGYSGGWTSIHDFKIISGAPSPTPTPTPTPTPPPTPTSWPDASNTGVPTGITLTPASGMTITVDNTIIDGKDITGQVTISADNVTIRNSRINTGSYFGIYVSSGTTGTVIEDTEVYASATHYTGILARDAIVRRVNVHDVENGIVADSNVSVLDSYIHDMAYIPGAHVDGIEWGATGNNITIDHNNIVIGGDTGAVNITPWGGGTANNIDVTRNLFSGGTYSLYIRGDGGGSVDGVFVASNVWVKNSYAYGTHSVQSASNITWLNNILDDNTVINL